MVEAGVDIDLDRGFIVILHHWILLIKLVDGVIVNFAPSKKGTVIIVKLINENDNNKPYANYVYGDILRIKTEELLSNLPDIVEESRF